MGSVFFAVAAAADANAAQAAIAAIRNNGSISGAFIAPVTNFCHKLLAPNFHFDYSSIRIKLLKGVPMFTIAMIALLAAVAPVQEVVEDLETQECEALAYEEFAEEGDEVVFADEVVSEEGDNEDVIVFDEE